MAVCIQDQGEARAGDMHDRWGMSEWRSGACGNMKTGQLEVKIRQGAERQ
jgi:hypothetical protein